MCRNAHHRMKRSERLTWKKCARQRIRPRKQTQVGRGQWSPPLTFLNGWVDWGKKMEAMMDRMAARKIGWKHHHESTNAQKSGRRRRGDIFRLEWKCASLENVDQNQSQGVMKGKYGPIEKKDSGHASYWNARMAGDTGSSSWDEPTEEAVCDRNVKAVEVASKRWL